METALIVLAIFGCTEDFNDCTKVDGPVMEFASKAECTRQIDDALGLRTDLPFPIITARCAPTQDEPLVAAAKILTTDSTTIR